MGRLNLNISDGVETEFRNSFVNFKKGDISRKVEDLIRNFLENNEHLSKEESREMKKLIRKLDKLFQKFYQRKEFSLDSANYAVLEWDKIKETLKV